MQISRKVTTIILVFISLLPLNAQNWDIETLHKINSIESTKKFSTFISESTSAVVIGAPLAMGAVALIEKNDDLLKKSIYIGVGTVVNATLTYGLKKAFNRPRPVETYPDMVNPYLLIGDRSFPSGHTSSAFALATSLTLAYPKWYVIAPSYVWACSVGYSRMNLGVHYPTDVMAGAVLGAGSAYATYVLNEYCWKKHENKKLLTSLANWESF